jgi:hypothetical protein
MLIGRPPNTLGQENVKWAFIRDQKPSAIAAALPTIIAFAVAITFVVTIGVFLTATGCTLAAMRRRSRRRHAPPANWHTLPEGRVGLNSRSVELQTGTKSYESERIGSC